MLMPIEEFRRIYGDSYTDADIARDDAIKARMAQIRAEQIRAGLRARYAHGCNADGGCPQFVDSGNTPGNAWQCMFSNTCGEWGCFLTRVENLDDFKTPAQLQRDRLIDQDSPSDPAHNRRGEQ